MRWWCLESSNWRLGAHLDHLQAVLKGFDPTAAPNEETSIRYFREGLRPSIRAQLDNRGRDLDSYVFSSNHYTRLGVPLPRWYLMIDADMDEEQLDTDDAGTQTVL